MSDNPECVVLVVHGVGNQQPGEIVEEFQAGLLSFLNKRMRRQTTIATQPAPIKGGLEKGYDLLLQADPASLPNETADPVVRVRLREFHWADLDGDPDHSFKSFLGNMWWVVKTAFGIKPCKLFPPDVGCFKGLMLVLRAAGLCLALFIASLLGTLLALVNALFKGRYNFLAKFLGILMEYLGDIKQMENLPLRRAVNQRLRRTIGEVLDLDRPAMLVLVSHSLGNVFVCDQLTRQLNPAPVPLGWISLGSPLWVLPILPDGYKLPHEMKMDLDLGWYNIYDPMDPLAGPVQHASLANGGEQWYREHWDPYTAHSAYFQNGGHLDRLWEAVCKGLEQLQKLRQSQALQESAEDTPRIQVRAPLNRRPLALGPFPRHGAPDELAIWTAHWQAGPHRARLLEGEQEVDLLTEEVRQEDQFTHLWRFKRLKPDTTYRLELFWQDQEERWWRLTRRNRLNEEVAKVPAYWLFKTPRPPQQGPWRFLFSSCHYPGHVHWDGLDGNWFTQRMVERFSPGRGAELDALFLIGDQIYADDWWEEHLLLPWDDQELRLNNRLATYTDCYRNFWRHQPWSDLLRLAPSYMMWDDHDLRDGWGSNVHDFVGDDFSDAAKEKFRAAFRAFALYQGVGNPPAPSAADFQYTLDRGPISFFIFDPRTYRQYRKPVAYHPYGPEQMERYRAWLKDAGERAQVMVVITSTPTAFIKGWRLNTAAYHMNGIMRWGEKFLHAEAFDDDLRDQLPCRLNTQARDAIVSGLAGVLMDNPPGTKRAVLVAGDVHVGAHSRIKLDQGRAIDLWTASPISNIPNWMLRWLAALALPGRPAGSLNGQQLKAVCQWTKSARNVVTLTMEPHPAPGQAPIVRGELLYESGFGVKSIKRVLG